MPIVPFDSLPDNARVWVFGSSKRLSEKESAQLLASVDEFLADWKAHGEPLSAGRNFSEDRFLTIAADQDSAHASGCSIDGLFRSLKDLETRMGTSLLDRSLVYYSDGSGVHSVHRDEFSSLAGAGKVNGDTTVIDPTVTTLGEWRARFHSKAANSWHAGLFPAASAKV
jgi:hypothetical protein